MSVVERGSASNPGGAVLTSKWAGLSRHLIASFFPVESYSSGDDKKVMWRRAANSVEVQAPLTDGNLEATLNWHSPFENTGADQKFSSLSALLQSGTLTPLAILFKEFMDKKGLGNSLTDELVDRTRKLEGRSSITKLNSTQVFNGMPPLKISVTAHFRALEDADVEVRRPLNQLMSWALPQELADAGPILELVRAGDPSLYPSRVPQILGMKFADMSIMPVVIESMPYPLTAPRDRHGTLLSAQVAMQISSLSALDARDWTAIQQGSSR